MRFSKYLENIIPPISELEKFSNNKDCYIVVEAIVKKFKKYKLDKDSGFYINKGKARDHAWNVAKDGTIIDVTYSQFNPKIKIGIWTKDMPEYKKYHSWDLHHNPKCLLKNLNVDMECEAPGCDYKGK